MDSNYIESPDCIDGYKNHDITGGERGDVNGMLFYSCSRCFERFFFVSETVLKKLNVICKPKQSEV